MQHEFRNGRILKLITGDITKVPVDAMANAANSGLRRGGGVDGAIHRAGGPEIMAELRTIGHCPTGGAVATRAGKLPAKYVFHAVGPVYRDGRQGEPLALASCYQNCLKLADARGVETISFPSISTGVYGYPVDDAARIAIAAVWQTLESGAGSVREAVFVLFDQGTFDAYACALTAWEQGKLK